MCKLKLFFARLLFKWFGTKSLKSYKIQNDTSDSRDWSFSNHNAMSTNLQDKVDLREYCSPVEDQLSTNSCVSQALVGNLEFLEKKKTGNHIELSRMFVYYTTRMFECDTKRDAGSQIRDGIKVLRKYGVCKEDLHPFTVGTHSFKPSNEAFRDAENRKITEYYRISSLEEMLQCINQGFPFVASIKLFTSFGESLDNGGIVRMPSIGEIPQGRHAILLVGFDLSTQTFIARNSWGEVHANGYFTIPFQYLVSYGDDMWTIRT